MSFPSYILEYQDQQKRYAEILKRLIVDTEMAEDYRAPALVLDYLEQKITYMEMLIQMESFYWEMLDTYVYDDSEESFMQYLNLQDTALNLVELIVSSDLTDEEQQSRIENIMEPINRYVNNVSFAERATYYDDMLADLCKIVLPLGQGIEEKEEYLMRLLIRRQPITYIHCLMVERIVELIVKSIHEASPEEWEKLLGSCKVNKDSELEFLRRCARLHDVGKCRVAGVINLQGRRLMDEEFTYIKKHPEKGLEFLEKDEAFRPYFDVILGHHKTFDGNGYPVDFDNTKSDKKAYIDLISIADSIDSATDILGRNYTRGKEFKVVLGELVEGAGTRYNGDLVSFIAADEKLCEALNTLTKQGRINIYYEAYRKIETS